MELAVEHIVVTFQAPTEPFQHRENGAGVHDRATLRTPTLDTILTGGSGGVVDCAAHGVTVAATLGVVPTLFIASTTTEYTTPDVSPATVTFVVSDDTMIVGDFSWSLRSMPSLRGRAATLYLADIGYDFGGGVHDTNADPTSATTNTFRGEYGGVTDAEVEQSR